MSDHVIHPETVPGSVHLTVRDLDRAVTFYQQSIGLRLHRRDGTTAHLGDGRADLLVLVENPAARKVKGTTGLYHFAILVPSRKDLAEALRRLAATGWPVEGFADHLVSEAVYLSDPEGNGIEIYRDRPREEWRFVNGQLQMATDPIDLDGVLAELQPGEPLQEQVPAGTVLGHMHLHVRNVPEADAFYTGVLGFGMMLHYGPTAGFTSAGGYHHHIGYNTWAGVGAPPPPPDAAGLRWFTVRLPDEGELTRVVDWVRTAGVPYEETPIGYLVHDPSRNAVVLTTAAIEHGGVDQASAAVVNASRAGSRVVEE